MWREAENGTTASQTPLLSYRPNVQRAPWSKISFSLGHVVFLFPFSPFSSNPLLHPPHPHPPAEGGYWWNNALFFSRFHIHERVSKEKQKKSQKRSDYCCGKRVWVTSLSRRKDKQVINAAGRHQEKLRLRASSGFCSARRNNTVQQPSQSGQTFAQTELLHSRYWWKQRAGLKIMMHKHHLGLDFCKLHLKSQ